MPVQNRKQPGSQNIAHFRRIGTGVMQRTLRNPAIEQSRYLQEFSEKGQLSHRRRVRASVPTYVNSAAGCDNVHFKIVNCWILERSSYGDNDLFELVFPLTHLVISLIR